MYGLRFVAQLSPDSVQSMNEFAKTFPEKVQKRVFKRAGVKASEAMVEKIKSHVPVSAKTASFIGPTKREMRTGRRHTRDSVAFKMKSYTSSGRVLFIMGYRSGENPLATLMEKGNFLTSPRMTKRKTKYVKKHGGYARMKKQRPDGTWRTTRELQRKRDNQRSIGSFDTGGGGDTRDARGRFKKGGAGHSTGDFPKSKTPFAPITTAAREMQSQIISIMEAEIRKGFERAFAREAGAF